MQMQVNNSLGESLGRITFNKRGEVIFLGDYSKEFYDFVQEAIRTGIMLQHDEEVRDSGKHIYILTQTPIFSSDKNFPLAFRRFLMEKGYIVHEKHPEVEEEIKRCLEEFPEDDAKTDLLKRLPEMSYLEQTYVLEQLKTFSEGEGK